MIDTIEEHKFIFDQEIMRETFSVLDVFSNFDDGKLKDMEIDNQICFSDKQGVLCMIQDKNVYFLNTDLILEKICQQNEKYFDRNMLDKNYIAKLEYSENLKQVFKNQNRDEFIFFSESKILKLQIKDLKKQSIKLEELIEYNDQIKQAIFIDKKSYLLNNKQTLTIIDDQNKKQIENVQQICYNVVQENIYLLNGQKIQKINIQNSQIEDIKDFDQENDQIVLLESQQNFIFILYLHEDEISLYVLNLNDKKKQVRDDVIELDNFLIDNEDLEKQTKFYSVYSKEHKLLILGSNKGTDFHIAKIGFDKITFIKDEKQLPAIANYQEESSLLRYMFLIPAKFTKQKNKFKTNNNKKDDDGKPFTIHVPILLISIDKFSRFSVWTLEEYDQQFKYQKMNETNYIYPINFQTDTLILEDNTIEKQQSSLIQNNGNQKIPNIFQEKIQDQKKPDFKPSNSLFGNNFLKKDEKSFDFSNQNKNNETPNNVFSVNKQNNKDTGIQNSFFGKQTQNLFGNETEQIQKSSPFFNMSSKQQNDSKQKTQNDKQNIVFSNNNIFKKQEIHDKNNNKSPSIFNLNLKDSEKQPFFLNNDSTKQNNKWNINSKPFQKTDTNTLFKQILDKKQEENQENIKDKEDMTNNLFRDINQEKNTNQYPLIVNNDSTKNEINSFNKNKPNQTNFLFSINNIQQQVENQQNIEPQQIDDKTQNQNIENEDLIQDQQQENEIQPLQENPNQKKQREKVEFKDFEDLLNTVQLRVKESQNKQEEIQKVLKLCEDEKQNIDEIRTKSINLQNIEENFQTDKNMLNYINKNISNCLIMSKTKKFYQNPQNQETRKLNQQFQLLENQIQNIYQYLRTADQLVTDLLQKKTKMEDQKFKQYNKCSNTQSIPFSRRFRRKHETNVQCNQNHRPYNDRNIKYIDFDINKMQTRSNPDEEQFVQNEICRKKLQNYWYQLKNEVDTYYREIYQTEKQQEKDIISLDISQIAKPKNLIDFSKINNRTEDNYWILKYIQQQQQLQHFISKNSELQNLYFDREKIQIFNKKNHDKQIKVAEDNTCKQNFIFQQKNQNNFDITSQDEQKQKQDILNKSKDKKISSAFSNMNFQNSSKKKDGISLYNSSKEKSVDNNKNNFIKSIQQSKEKQGINNSLFDGKNIGSLFQGNQQKNVNKKEDQQGNTFLNGGLFANNKNKDEQKQPTSKGLFGQEANSLFGKNLKDDQNNKQTPQTSFFNSQNRQTFFNSQNNKDQKDQQNNNDLKDQQQDQAPFSQFSFGKEKNEELKVETKTNSEKNQGQQLQSQQDINVSNVENKNEQDNQNREKLFTFSESQNNQLKPTLPELPQNMDMIFNTQNIQSQIQNQKEEEKNQEDQQEKLKQQDNKQELGMSQSQQIDPNNLLSQSDISKVQNNLNNTEEQQDFKGMKVNKIQSISQFQSPEKQTNILGMATKQVNSIETEKQQQDERKTPVNQMQDSFAQIKNQSPNIQNQLSFGQNLPNQQSNNNEIPKSGFFMQNNTNIMQNNQNDNMQQNQQQNQGFYQNQQQNQNNQQQNFGFKFDQQNQNNQQNNTGSNFGQNSFFQNNHGNRVNKQLDTSKSGFFNNNNQALRPLQQSPMMQNTNNNQQGQNNNFFSTPQNNIQQNFNQNNNQSNGTFNTFGTNQNSINSAQQINQQWQNNSNLGNNNSFINQQNQQSSGFGQQNQQKQYGLDSKAFMQNNPQNTFQNNNNNQFKFQIGQGGLFGARK